MMKFLGTTAPKPKMAQSAPPAEQQPATKRAKLGDEAGSPSVVAVTSTAVTAASVAPGAAQQPHVSAAAGLLLRDLASVLTPGDENHVDGIAPAGGWAEYDTVLYKVHSENSARRGTVARMLALDMDHTVIKPKNEKLVIQVD